jgi:hypothetical protein
MCTKCSPLYSDEEVSSKGETEGLAQTPLPDFAGTPLKGRIIMNLGL